MAKIAFGKTETLAPAQPQTVTPADVGSVPAEIVASVPAEAKAAVVASPTVTAPAVPATPATGVTSVVTPNPGAVVVATPTAVTTPSANPGYHDDENISAGDLKLPRLNIVQKVGEMSTIHPNGAIVLDGNLVLVDAPKQNAESAPIRWLCIGLQSKKFVEKVEGGLRGNIFDTEEQVVKANGTLDYNEAKATGKTVYQTLVTALVLIEKPASVDENAFPLEFNGVKYALALFSMKGTSYTHAAKHLFTARKMGACREGYRNSWWTMTTKLKSSNGHIYYIPTVRPQEKSTPELRAFLSELLGF